ncbi:MAG: UbiX family flavin prenyltransferase [Deltaproteobacteria bacterium]|jgi:4-hydroxy-3-polyprenylbenzoate decarboxylase|nr:UbiX family flavin prenyltransferase [Deltaproteobacteria bacterium]MBW2476851.1 UbiX family flavin prenyltransferase [Deltaproteobacteria bacterium]MBW2503595.1 UbiX family flavin prenyltransferase [Deltaproteobacteria bacterium]MBW2519805.1 UbiX family flavin prenyltransferase [Deltaproteobacteria bacterium]
MTTERFTIRHCAVAITGASGAAYGLRLVKELLGADQRVTLLLTTAGRQVVQHEVGLKLEEAIAERRRQVQDHFASIAVDCVANDDYFSGLASGSAAPDVMVVAPCSMGTAGRIAAGLSNNLIERAADVMLKEKRPLILVPRETPLNTIHLENLLRLASAGAVILPAMPAFYHNPPSIEALIDFVVGKILDQIGIAHRLYARWGESQE